MSHGSDKTPTRGHKAQSRVTVVCSLFGLVHGKVRSLTLVPFVRLGSLFDPRVLTSTQVSPVRAHYQRPVPSADISNPAYASCCCVGASICGTREHFDVLESTEVPPVLAENIVAKSGVERATLSYTSCLSDFFGDGVGLKMMNNSIVRNAGHFDNEIDLASLEGLEGFRTQMLVERRLLEPCGGQNGNA